MTLKDDVGLTLLFPFHHRKRIHSITIPTDDFLWDLSLKAPEMAFVEKGFYVGSGCGPESIVMAATRSVDLSRASC